MNRLEIKTSYKENTGVKPYWRAVGTYKGVAYTCGGPTERAAENELRRMVKEVAK